VEPGLLERGPEERRGEKENADGDERFSSTGVHSPALSNQANTPTAQHNQQYADDVGDPFGGESTAARMESSASPQWTQPSGEDPISSHASERLLRRRLCGNGVEAGGTQILFRPILLDQSERHADAANPNPMPVDGLAE